METEYKKALERARNQDLKNVRFLNKYQGSIITGFSPNKFKEFGESVHAKITIGKNVRYDRKIIEEALEKQRNIEGRINKNDSNI